MYIKMKLRSFPKAVWKGKITPPISYQGSKRREMGIIEKFAPYSFNKFIDPFGGGGSASLYFYQNYNIDIFYNDINPCLTELFTILKSKEKTAELIKNITSIPVDINTFKDIQKKYKKSLKNGTPNLVDYMYLSRLGFRGNPMAAVMNGRKNKDGLLILEHRALSIYNRLLEYPEILNKFHFDITNKDAKEVLLKYKNDKRAFIYLDPPYLSKNMDNGNYMKASMDDIMFIIDYIKDEKTKAKVMLHIDFSGWTYDMLKNNMILYYPSSYNISIKDNGKIYHKKYQMIATNYKKFI